MSFSDWGYSQTNGPSTWPERFPHASGSRQSPVDVITSKATSDATLENRPLSWTYVDDSCLSIINPGYGWRVDVNGDGTELSGGPLGHRYKLEQFHCHWGSCSGRGSEHTIDGKAYAGELHLVHWNCEKYATFNEAAAHHDGLAVLGVLLEVGPDDHPELAKIVSLISNIIYRGKTAPVNEKIDPNRFIPEQTHYWTYEGSLTTPPCSESVTWILFKEPIGVSEDQISVFRTMRSYSQEEVVPADELQGQLLYNYRPALPLGNRELRECGSV